MMIDDLTQQFEDSMAAAHELLVAASPGLWMWFAGEGPVKIVSEITHSSEDETAEEIWRWTASVADWQTRPKVKDIVRVGEDQDRSRRLIIREAAYAQGNPIGQFEAVPYSNRD